MREHPACHIAGVWDDPQSPRFVDVVDPATDEPFGRIALGGPADVDRAVAAARAALPAWSATSVADRVAALDAIIEAYRDRLEELASTITAEMGAPVSLATAAQAPAGLAHLANTATAAREFEWSRRRGTSLLRYGPIGVCGLITPWNWSTNQIMCKVAPALAAGCTMVLKPSEFTPFSACILMEAMQAAGLPDGVVNLVVGDGPGVGSAIAAHAGIDMVSFTGSTAAGIAVAKAAADTVKRVSQELGGKSANIVLADADLDRVVARGVAVCMNNSGQSCNAPTRMLVPRERYDEAVQVAAVAASALTVGDPRDPATRLGPVANRRQWERVQAHLEAAIAEGAVAAAGGPGRPEGLDRGCYVRPTVFAGVTPDMGVAREEVFGPVLAMIAYDTEDEAVAIANDSPYGLSGYVQSGSLEHAMAVASRLRVGQVHLNGAPADFTAPFGGFKRSGNGREWGVDGLEEYLEVTALMGVGE